MKATIIFQLVVIVLLCTTNPAIGQNPATDSLHFKPIGRLVDIGGYSLHINCTGTGKTTVVFINGAFGFSFDWTLIQRELSPETRVCSYDRPGLAWSDAGPLPHTLAQSAYELHKLLKAAKIAPPYILAGQSIGGLIARKFAREYPAEVAGLVLVDAASENGLFGVNGKIERLRLLASPDKKIPALKDGIDTFSARVVSERIAEFLKVGHVPKINPLPASLQDSLQNYRAWAGCLPKYSTAEGGELWAEEFAQIYADSAAYRLADKPLIVLCSIRNDYDKGWNMRDSMMAEKLRNQQRVASLSTNSKLVTTEKSGHEIHITEPSLVADAIRQVLYAVSHKSRLSD